MILFGPSGNSESFFAEKHKTTEEAAVWCRDRGLEYFEYSFGRGVNMSEEKATSIGRAFEEAGVGISVHAPYFINLSGVLMYPLFKMMRIDYKVSYPCISLCCIHVYSSSI